MVSRSTSSATMPELGLAVGHIHGHIGIGAPAGPRLPQDFGHDQLGVRFVRYSAGC